jgi:gluconolactonase
MRVEGKIAMLAALLSTLTAVGQAEPPPIPGNAKPHTVVGDIAFAEGPIFDRDGNLYFVNYHHIGSIGRRTPDGTVTVWCETGGRANGLKVDAQGFIVAADFDGKRILRIPPSGSPVEVLTSEFEGQPYQGPNDVCLDHAGNVYFSDPGNFQTPTSSVYRIATDGTVTRVAGEIAYPNGLAVSPDQKRLYVAESATNRLLAWDLAPDGTATNGRMVRQFPDETLDGMMFDEYGRLWIARWTHGTVDVVSQEGELLGSIPTGGTQVTNLCWWGTQLHVTVAGSQAIVRFEVGCRAAP